jgi:broad specificity phosphatase PhoE
VGVEIVYETHATSTDNEAGIATGWLGGVLSETGKRQALELGERRRATGLAVVFTSDLARAVQTAEIAFAGSSLPVRPDQRLRECNYGRLNGTTAAAIEQQRRLRLDDPFPGGESYRDVVDHVLAFLAEIRPEFDDRRVLLIGHAATRWALDHLIDGAAISGHS